MPASERSAEREHAGLFYGYVVAFVSSFIMVLVFAVHYSFGIFFKPVISDFGWTRAQTSGAFSLVWIVQGLLAFVMGGLTDRIGPRRVLTICGTLIGSGYLLMSGITALWQLYIVYGVVIGAGLGGTFVPLTSTTGRWFVARRGLMTGVVAAGVGLGAFIGPPIANALIAGYHWRFSYRVFGLVVLIGVTIAAQFLKRDPSEIGAHPDGVSADARSPLDDTNVGLGLRQAMETPQFWLVSLVFYCYGFALSAVLLHLAPHATDVGITSAHAASILATLGGASVAGKVLLGVAADRVGNKNVYATSFCLMAISLTWLMLLRQEWMFFAAAAIFGFAYGGLAAAHAPLVAWLFGMKQHGLVFGASFNAWTVGCAIGPLVAGYLYDRSHEYGMAFGLCLALSLAGALLTAQLKPVDARRRAPRGEAAASVAP